MRNRLGLSAAFGLHCLPILCVSCVLRWRACLLACRRATPPRAPTFTLAARLNHEGPACSGRRPLHHGSPAPPKGTSELYASGHSFGWFCLPRPATARRLSRLASLEIWCASHAPILQSEPAHPRRPLCGIRNFCAIVEAYPYRLAACPTSKWAHVAAAVGCPFDDVS